MLGGLLKDARMRQGLSIEDLERETSIRKAYISALEEEQWDVLPSPVYVKGFIRNLSNFLHIDSIPLIEEYISILNGNIGAPKVEDNSNNEADLHNNKKDAKDKDLLGMPLKEKPSKKKKSGAFLTVALIVALVGAGAFYFMNKDKNPASDTTTTQATEEKDKTVTETAKPKPTKVTEKIPVASNAPASAPQQQQTQATQPQQAQPADQAQPAQPAAGVNVSAKFNGNCWIQVIVDGNVVFEDIAEDGSNLSWQGNDTISIVAGNAGAMEVTHNGKNVGAMGAYGQVAEKVFTK